MLKFLLDANISPLTKEFLENKFGYDVKTVQEVGLKHALDQEIVELAQKEKRIIITLDLDFGEIYYFSSPQDLGIIVLRPKSQTVDEVHRALNNFLLKGILAKHQKSLIVVDELKYRIRTR